MKHTKTFGWLSLILIVAVMISVIGCGKGGNQSPTPTTKPTATATTYTEPSGETGALSGIVGAVQVKQQGAGSWIEATSGMKIGTGDSLRTGSDGYVLITFFDGSVMELQADTEISVEELSVASGGSTTVLINQVIGTTLNRVENLVDSSSKYEIETLAGSAVVRGTLFLDEVERNDGVTHTCISTLDEEDEEDHYVDFINAGKTVEVPEGKTACSWEGGVPGNPFYTDPDDSPANFSGGGGSCYGYNCHSRPVPTPTPGLECSPGCYFYMVDNGYCNGECYNAACIWDGGDCVY